MTEKIPIDKGVGMKFLNWDDKECITLPRKNPVVNIHIITYSGLVAFAEHFHASLNINSLNCKIIGDTSNNTFSGNQQPEESQDMRIDAEAPAKKDWYEDKEHGGKFLVLKKGMHTTRFDTIEDCIEAIEYTFKQRFDSPPWILKKELYDRTWEEEKERLLKKYKV